MLTQYMIGRVGHRLDFNDSDSNSDSSFRFQFLSILDSDSLSGGVETGHTLISQIRGKFYFDSKVVCSFTAFST